MTWPKDRVIHRVHLNICGSSEFKGNARFGLIKAADGASIPRPVAARHSIAQRWRLPSTMYRSPRD